MSFDDQHCIANMKTKSMVSLNHDYIRPRKKKSLPLIQKGFNEKSIQVQKLKQQVKAINVRLKGEENAVIHSLIPKAKKSNPQVIDIYKQYNRRKRSQTLLSQYYSSLDKIKDNIRSQILLTPNIRKITNIKLNQNQIKQYLSEVKNLKRADILKNQSSQLIIHACPSRQALVYSYEQQIQQKLKNKKQQFSLRTPKKSSRQPALKISPMPILFPKIEVQSLPKVRKTKTNKMMIDIDEAPNNTIQVREMDSIRLIDENMRERLESYSLNFCKRKKLKDLSFSILKKQHECLQGISPWQSHTSHFIQTFKS